MNITGKILEIFDTQNVTDTFKKREFVIEYADNSQYPQFLKFEMVQDRCDQLNDYQPGDEVVVHFDLRGRKWTDPQGNVKYFNSLQAWRLEKQQAAGPAPEDMPPPPAEEGPLPAGNDNDDLPF